MFKNFSYVLVTLLFLSACGKKNAVKPTGVIPQANKNSPKPSQPVNPTQPSIPTPGNPNPSPQPTSVLEGSWATGCLPNADAGAKQRFVTVTKSLMKYEELSFSDPKCTGPGLPSNEYTAYIVVGPYEDSVVTHGVDEYDEEENFLYTWYFRLDGNRFLDIREEFLTTRSTEYYGDYYYKVK